MYEKYMRIIHTIIFELQLDSKYSFLSLIILLMFIVNNNIYAQSDTIDVYDLTLTQLSEIKITSVTKTYEYPNEIPSTIYIITAEEIKENGYFTLDEVLSDLPGFQFRNTLGYNSYIFQRGIPNQNNLILLLIDGIQINELNSGGFYGGGQYNLSNVERIEVVYGPSSVAYGTNAVSGIINIVTRNANQNILNINTLVGSFNTTEGDFTYSITNERKTSGILFSGMFKRTDKADLKGKSGDYNWTDLMDNYENDYSFDLKFHSGNFIFGTNYINKQTSTATFKKSVGTSYKDYGTFWNIQFINSYVKYSLNLSKTVNFASMLYYRNATVLDNTIYHVVDTAQIGYYRPNNLFGIESILNFNISKSFSITGGITFEFDQLSESNTLSYSNSPEQKPPAPENPRMLNNNLISIFIEPKLVLFENLYVFSGLRFDQSSVYDQVLTPRVGLNYHLRNHILRFSYAEAFRAPKPWDYTSGIGNPSLHPEKMKSIEVGASFVLMNHLNAEIVGYNNCLKNALFKEETDGEFRWINKGEVNTDGVEIFLKYTSRRLKLSLNYTFTQSVDELNRTVSEISKHSANIGITYLLNKYWRVNLRANYLGARDNPKPIDSIGNVRIDPYTVISSTISAINYKGFDFRFIVKNVFDSEYYHTSNNTPSRYRQPQRTFMLSVGYHLNE